jgi:hypothetical protein
MLTDHRDVGGDIFANLGRVVASQLEPECAARTPQGRLGGRAYADWDSPRLRWYRPLLFPMGLLATPPHEYRTCHKSSINPIRPPAECPYPETSKGQHPHSRRLSGARRTDRDSDDCQIARGPIPMLNEINGLPGPARSWRGCGQSASFRSLRCWLRSRYHLRVRGPVMASPLDFGPRVRKDGGAFFF